MRLLLDTHIWLWSTLEVEKTSSGRRERPRRRRKRTLAFADQHLGDAPPSAKRADLFLPATARGFDLTLVTADRRLIQSGAAPVLKNR